MKRIGVTVVVLALVVSGVAGAARATNPPSVSDYTDAQLHNLAATPNPAQDDSLSYGLPAYVASTSTKMLPAYYACWNDTRQQYHGTWPQEQQVYLNTLWCGSSAGIVQTRSSYVTMHTTLCSSHDPYNARRDGGVGTRYVDVEGGAYFDCPTGIPWVQTHWHVWLVVRYWGGGGVQVIARSS